MDSKSYVKNVLVTEARDFTAVVQRMSEPRNIRLIHASAGITSEISELIVLTEDLGTFVDRVNLMEECGDILWYIGIAADTLGKTEEICKKSEFVAKIVKHDDDLIDCLFNASSHLSRLSGQLADLVIKKAVFYGKTVDDGKIIDLLSRIHDQVEYTLHEAGYTIEQARERNIAKLKARYGEKFTEAAALERNLELERKVLETK